MRACPSPQNQPRGLQGTDCDIHITISETKANDSL